MKAFFGKKTDSSGRSRAHSMLSILNTVHQKQVASTAEPDHEGIPIERLNEPYDSEVNVVASGGVANMPATENPGGVMLKSPVSALTMAFQGITVDGTAGSEPKAIGPSVARSVGGSSLEDCHDDSCRESDEDIASTSIEDQPDLRKWCTGQPPKKSFLGPDAKLPGRLPMIRRSTLADKPELDLILASTKVEYRGHIYVPLTAHVIHRLSPYWKGEKPVADTKVFECIMINSEVNGIHADHVVAALQRIGEYCKHLLVVSPIQTSELGNVFVREDGEVEPGNDWEHLLKCFPNLKYLAFVHDIDEHVELSRGTFYALHTAISNCQAAQAFKSFKYEGPPQLLTNFNYDFARALAKAQADGNAA